MQLVTKGTRTATRSSLAVGSAMLCCGVRGKLRCVPLTTMKDVFSLSIRPHHMETQRLVGFHGFCGSAFLSCHRRAPVVDGEGILRDNIITHTRIRSDDREPTCAVDTSTKLTVSEATHEKKENIKMAFKGSGLFFT